MTDLPTLPSRLRHLPRRDFLMLAGGAAAAAVAATWGLSQVVHAQRKKPAGPSEVSVEELMKPGSLPDLVLGKADAPITIVEYASMTCGHCASFHNKVLPDVLKEKYIDTGKARLIMSRVSARQPGGGRLDGRPLRRRRRRPSRSSRCCLPGT